MSRVIKKFVLTVFLFSVFLSSQKFSQADEAVQILDKMEKHLRSFSHHMTVDMKITTKRWKRDYKFELWMRGQDDTFSRVLEPADVRGQAFLRDKAKLWSYLPTVERTILIPPSMMLDKFMGSDFSNDDFVKMSYLPRDYDGKIVGEETLDGTETHRLTLTPKPQAPVTYGKLEIWTRKKDAQPVKVQYFNEKMVHVRTLHYSDFKTFGTHEVPAVWRMENHQKPGNETILSLVDAEFDLEIPDSVFSKANLEEPI